MTAAVITVITGKTSWGREFPKFGGSSPLEGRVNFWGVLPSPQILLPYVPG